MKKIVLLFLFTFLFVILNTQRACACSCAPLDLDRHYNNSDQVLFTGKVIKVITPRTAIVEVNDNLGVNSLNKYQIVYSGTIQSTACGINFMNYKNETLLISGTIVNNKIKTNSCSKRTITNDSIEYVEINDTLYDYSQTISLSEVKNKLNTIYESNGTSFGDIKNEDNLNALTLRAYLPMIIPVAGIGLLTIFMIIILKKHKKEKINP